MDPGSLRTSQAETKSQVLSDSCPATGRCPCPLQGDITGSPWPWPWPQSTLSRAGRRAEASRVRPERAKMAGHLYTSPGPSPPPCQSTLWSVECDISLLFCSLLGLESCPEFVSHSQWGLYPDPDSGPSAHGKTALHSDGYTYLPPSGQHN